MARSRFCKPDFFDNPVLAQCSHRARLLFIATWQLADRAGVFEWDEAKIRKYAFGYEDITIVELGSLLAELLAKGFIQHGEFGGKRYGRVPNLARHQPFHKDEKPRFDDVSAGTIWRPSTEHSASTVPAPGQHSANRTDNLLLITDNCELVTVNQNPADAPSQTRAQDKLIDTKTKARPTKPMEPFVLSDFRRIALELDRTVPVNWDDDDARAAGKIYAKYPHGYQAVLRRYLADDFYGRYGWSIQNLAKNLDAIANRQSPEETDPMKVKLGF